MWLCLLILLLCLFDQCIQMGIPEGAERRTDRIMEEFHIPHTSAPPPPVGEELIRIDEIDDEILQIGFRGELEHVIWCGGK